MTTYTKDSKTKCPHCKAETLHGTHNGCGLCGKVKHTGNGQRVPKVQE